MEEGTSNRTPPAPEIDGRNTEMRQMGPGKTIGDGRVSAEKVSELLDIATQNETLWTSAIMHLEGSPQYIVQLAVDKLYEGVNK